MDTSPEASGKNVNPQIIKNYNGQDIVLPGDKSKVIKVAETEGLAELKGKTVITSDGTTLLGADDKAGVAVIMTTAAHLMANPNLKHGPIRVCFTTDEEVGRGTDKVDIKTINATCAYTLDGEAAGGIENETFSADLATITVTGINIHPGLAYGKMVNAIRVAGDFLSRLPKEFSPECTKERDGFLHPYIIEGGVPEVRIKTLLRSFDSSDLPKQAKLLKDTSRRAVMADWPKVKIAVEVKKQYRNMVEALEQEPPRRQARRPGLPEHRPQTRVPIDPRRHRRLAPERDGPPDAEHLNRHAQLPLRAGVRLPGADGISGQAP